MAHSKNSTLAISLEHSEKLQRIVSRYNIQHPTRPTNGKNLIGILIDYMYVFGCDKFLNGEEKYNPNEEWKDIVSYEGEYQISSCGRVRRLETVVENKTLRKGKRRLNEIILTERINIFGERYVTLNYGQSYTIDSLLRNHF